MKLKPFADAGGYTTFDNDALDYVMPLCKPNTWKIICATMRKTRGWQKESDVISITQYMELTGIKNRSTLSRAIQDALDQGFILRIENGQSYSYSINKQYEIDTSTENGLVQKVYQNRYRNRTRTSTENGHTKENKKNKKTTSVQFPDELNVDSFLVVWDEWVQYRKEIKKPLNPTSIKYQLNKLKKHSPETAAAMLAQSIENQWQGIFELKDGAVSKVDLKVNQDGSVYV